MVKLIAIPHISKLNKKNERKCISFALRKKKRNCADRNNENRDLKKINKE